MINTKFIKFLGKLESVSSPADRATINTIRGKYAAMMEMGTMSSLKGLTSTGVTRGADMGRAFGNGSMKSTQTPEEIAQKAAEMQQANNKVNKNLALLNGCKTQLINKSGLDPVELEVWVKRELLPAIRYAAENKAGLFDADVYGSDAEKQRAGRAKDHADAVAKRMSEERENMNYYERATDAAKNGDQGERAADLNQRIQTIESALAQLSGNDPEVKAERSRLEAELKQLKTQSGSIGKRSMWGRMKSFFKGEAINVIANDPALFESLCKCTDAELRAIAKSLNG